jgi:hypothetical protein
VVSDGRSLISFGSLERLMRTSLVFFFAVSLMLVVAAGRWGRDERVFRPEKEDSELKGQRVGHHAKQTIKVVSQLNIE